MRGVDEFMLVLASFGAAAMTAFVVLEIGARISFFDARRQPLWLVGGALVMGTSLWSMHFLGMRASGLPVDIHYDAATTATAWISAVLVSAMVLFIVSRRRLSVAPLLAAAVAMGFGICFMHYLGLAALRLQPGIAFDATKIAASLLLASVASAAAMFACFHNARRKSSGRRLLAKLVASALIGGATCLTHFVGMSAARILPGATSAPENLVPADWMGFPVALLAAITGTLLLLVGLRDSAILGERERQRLSLKRAQAERVLWLRDYDPVTGLLNQSCLTERLSHHMFPTDGSTPGPFGLVHIELRSHRAILEHLGEERFDAVLRGLAGQFSKVTRDGDLVARVSDAGFLFMLLDRPNRHFSTAMNALLGPLSSPVYLGDDQFKFIWTLGSSRYPQAGDSPQSLIRLAMRPQRQVGDEPQTRPVDIRRYSSMGEAA